MKWGAVKTHFFVRWVAVGLHSFWIAKTPWCKLYFRRIQVMTTAILTYPPKHEQVQRAGNLVKSLLLRKMFFVPRPLDHFQRAY